MSGASADTCQRAFHPAVTSGSEKNTRGTRASTASDDTASAFVAVFQVASRLGSAPLDWAIAVPLANGTLRIAAAHSSQGLFTGGYPIRRACPVATDFRQ